MASHRSLLASLLLLVGALTHCGGATDLSYSSGHAGGAGKGGSSALATGGAAGEAENAASAGQATENGGEAASAGQPAENAGAPAENGGAAGEGSGGTTDAVPVAIEVTPPALSVAVGTKAVLVATARYADSTTRDVSATATWTSSTALVATVAGGTVSGIKAGTSTISATLSGIVGTALVTVPAATVTSISVTPGTASTGIAGNITFSAVVTLSDGSSQDVSSTAVWSSSDLTIASVGSSGVAVGLAPGTVTVQALAAGLTGTATLTVTEATLESIAVTPSNPTTGVGTSLAFTATGTFSDGSVSDVSASATWASSASGVASLDPTTHSATALTAGSTTISAAVMGVSGSTLLTVTAASLQSIVVTPATSTIAVNGTISLTATGTYSDGTTLDVTQSVTWSSGSANVASVSNASTSRGLVQGLAGGTAVITATFQGVSAAGNVTVSDATLVSLAITPDDPTLPKSTTVSLTATGTYSDGTQIDVTQSVTWTTADATIATVGNGAGQRGVLSALAAGTTLATAQLDGIQGTTTITVTSATLVSIAVTPANVTLAPAATRAMTAIGTFSDNSTADLTTSAVWASSDSATATVSNDAASRGLVTAMDAGTTTLGATFGGVTGSTTVTVAAATLDQIVLDPVAASVPLGQAVRYTATAIYSDNTQRDITGQASWTSSNTSVATLGRQGMGGFGGPGGQTATTLAVGTTTISAAYQGLSGTTTLTVTSATVSQIVITPINPTLPVGATQALVATAIYSDNTSQTITGQATWSSSATGVAQVSTGGGGGRPGGGGAPGANGTVTALGAGAAQISASWGGVTGSTTVTVTAATLASISVSPSVASLAVGGEQQFTATAIFSDNTSRDVTAAATWVSSDVTVAGVTDAGGAGGGKGLAKALAAGTATVSASYGGLTGSATLTITDATLVEIDLTPVQPSVSAGTTVQFTATAIFSDDTSRNVTSLSTWTSSNAAVAAVSTSAGTRGQAQALSSGVATINATYNGVKGSTALQVSSATLTEIQITPFSPTVLIGFATPLVATGVYSDLTTVDLTRSVTWTSSAASTASVANSGANKGLLTPLAAGGAVISASYQGVTGQDAVTVSDATVASIAVTPAGASIAVHATQPFTALATLSDGSSLDVTTFVTWVSSTPAIASISNATGSVGVATGLSAGSVTIKAVRGAVSGTASFSVQ